MKVAILAGGRGTRLLEETAEKPKALVEIGDRPIVWHIMKHYAHYSFTDFIIATGYKGEEVLRYFAERGVDALACEKAVWDITLVETGLETQTGGRIKQLADHIGDETFMLTWCDGVSAVNLRELFAFHRSHGRLATLTAVHPPSRFGHLVLDDCKVVSFSEKPRREEVWINGAFFVLEPGVFDYIDGCDTEWERDSLPRLATEGQLMAYRCDSFWQCMDTLHETRQLNVLWQRGEAPWKVWD